MWWMFAFACEEAPVTMTTDIDAHRDVRLDELALAVAHNAMNSEADGFLLPNQTLGYEDQLALGVRGFMLDVHDDDGVLSLCHSDCGLGREDLSVGLARFAAWLDANPDELIVFIVQDEVPPAGLIAAAEAAGLDRWAVDPPADGAWPTWGELVDADQRLLWTTEGRHEGVPAWFMHTYDLAWDNNYAARAVADFDCAVLRGDRNAPFFLLNHFLTAPVGSAELAAQANTEASLREHVDRCEAETGDLVAWLAVDFVDIGDTMAVVDELNARRAD
jgi:hypothetical protein